MSYGEILTEKDLSKGLDQTIWKPHHQSIRAVGCKIFHKQLCDSKFAHILDEIIVNPEIRIIDLGREDVLATYTSLKTAEKLGDWSSSEKVKKATTDIQIYESEFGLFSKELKENRSKVLGLLEAHKILPLIYEHLRNDEEVQLRKLQEFLRLNPTKLFSLLKKQAKENADSSDDLG